MSAIIPERDADYVRLVGGFASAVYWADPADVTELPDDLGPLDTDIFIPVGWTQQDGKTIFAVEKDSGEIIASEGGSVIKRPVNKVTQRVTFTCLEDTPTVNEAAFINPVVVTNGVARQDITSNQNRSVRKVLVIDSASQETEGELDRYVFSMAILTFTGEVALVDSTGTPREFPFDALIPAGAAGYRLSNAASLGGSITP